MLLFSQITIQVHSPLLCGGATVQFLVRPLLILSATMFLLVACTRERPTPEPTATVAVQVADPQTVPTTADPVSPTVPITGETSVEGGIAVTTTPGPNETPTPATQENFQYIVQPGDTLGTVAERFETDIEMLRRLNRLDSDALSVGQPINVPYVEGMTVEGMPTPTPGPFLYTVQVGDTLTGLALRFGVSSAAILEANSSVLLDPNNLAIGATILIPGYQPPTDASAAGEDETATGESSDSVVHVVQAGQGLIGIAALYGVSVDEIVAANNLTSQDILRIGQELVIPGVTELDVAIATGSTHVVQLGESLLSIALTYGVTVAEIQEANDLDNPDSIFIGQELIIPGQ